MEVLDKIHKKYSREIIMYLDLDYIIKDVSSNFYNVLGYKKEEVVGKNLNQFTDKKIQVNGNRYLDKINLLDKSKIKRYFNTEANKVLEDGIYIGIYFSMFEIEESDYEVNYKQDILKQLCDKSKDIIYRYEIYPKPKFTYINSSIEKILGISQEEVYNNPRVPFQLIHEDDLKKIENRVNSVGEFKLESELRYRNSKGEYIWLEDFCIPTYDENGKLLAIQGISRCIQSRKELEEKLEYLSYTDSLTGVGNREYLKREVVKICKDKKIPIGTIVLDIDNLKDVNDSYGHSKGDKLIVYVANILREVFIENSFISRVGGDEFVILLKNISEEYIKERLELLERKVLEKNKNVDIKIKVSKGYYFSKEFCGDILNIIDKADFNMYIDKKNKGYKKTRGIVSF